MKRFHEATFSNSDTLECATDRHLHSQLGICVSEKFTHTGFNPPRECVEIQRETIMVRTQTSVRLSVDSDVWHIEAKECTRLIIQDLDTTIAELTAHRDRLKQSLQDPALTP